MSHACRGVRAGEPRILSPDGQIHCELQAATLSWTERKPAVVSQISPNRSTLENAEIILQSQFCKSEAHAFVMPNKFVHNSFVHKRGLQEMW